MLFNEIYGSYFHVVSSILSEASAGQLTDKRMTEIVSQKAFAESTLSIPTALKQHTWPLLRDDLTSVLHSTPTSPLTLLEKRWMKALLQDPRIALFDPDITGLEDIEPLYHPDTFVYFDRYTDGDPYDNGTYISNFKTVLQAIKEKRCIKICFHSHNGTRRVFTCIPYRLEYSPKDDKFRLLAISGRDNNIVNLARVHSCTLLEPYEEAALHFPKERLCKLTLLLHDKRNALERVLLHFSHFEKETARLEDDKYQITLTYDKEDETELLIRVLSFGPVLQVIAPLSFVGQIKARLAAQKL